LNPNDPNDKGPVGVSEPVVPGVSAPVGSDPVGATTAPTPFVQADETPTAPSSVSTAVPGVDPVPSVASMPVPPVASEPSDVMPDEPATPQASPAVGTALPSDEEKSGGGMPGAPTGSI